MLNDKIHVIELNYFIKLFFYSIQNRDKMQLIKKIKHVFLT